MLIILRCLVCPTRSSYFYITVVTCNMHSNLNANAVIIKKISMLLPRQKNTLISY